MFEKNSPLTAYCEATLQIDYSNWVEGYKIGLELKEPTVLLQAMQASKSVDPKVFEMFLGMY